MVVIFISKLIENLNNNEYFTFLISAVGLMGFFISIVSYIKATNIKKIIYKINRYNDFKIERKSIVNSLEAYRNILLNDISMLSSQEKKRLMIKWSDEIRDIKIRYSSIISFKIFIFIHILLHKLNSTINNKSINKLIKYISILKSELNNLEVTNDFK